MLFHAFEAMVEGMDPLFLVLLVACLLFQRYLQQKEKKKTHREYKPLDTLFVPTTCFQGPLQWPWVKLWWRVGGDPTQLHIPR